MDEHAQSYETKDEALKSDPDFVKFWLNAIDAASDEEKDWRKDADEVVGIYRGDKDCEKEFNIVYSNVETLLPAIYNSVPVPDVRRRFGDRDEVGKVVSQILERAISYSVDSYDFDVTMRAALFDAAVPGRGVARVRYIPYMGEDGNVAHEEVTCEYVPWKHFRRGASRVWEETPWIAFEHFLSRDELRKLNETLADKVQLDCTTRGEDAEDDQQKSDIFKRARVWEIWDKESKEVIFIATGYAEEALRRERDPLELSGFYPIPRPIQPIVTPGKLVPVTPYNSYKSLAEELNSVTARIKKLVRQLRVKGGYAAMGSDLEALSKADDGDLVPLTNMEFIATQGGDINKVVSWWPMDPTVKALTALYQQRESIKQTIYEVTGISDVVRGQSVASETATAQNIKNQWGSLRIQKLQADVQRFARDLFRLKAEVICTVFKYPERLISLLGVQVPPEQMPQVIQVMKSDVLRTYKVDVESDSTIRADLTRNQENMANFLQGTAQYIAAVAPAVQAGQMPGEVAVEIFTAFARNFKLGKQAEDALDRMGDNARKPQPPKPDPEMEKAKMQQQIEQAKMQNTVQLEQAKMEMEREKSAAQMQLEQFKAQQQIALEQYKVEQQMQLEQYKTQQQVAIDGQKMQMDYSLKSEAQANDHALKREGQAAEHEMAREAQATDGAPATPKSKKAAMGPLAEAIKSLGEIVTQQSQKAEERHSESMAAIAAGQEQMMRIMAAPQKIVRDGRGQVIGAVKDVRMN
jgi:hypothetical protein